MTGEENMRTMHPMFVKLFIEPDSDDLLAADEDKKRRVRRAGRGKQVMVTRAAARGRDRRPRP
jgi:hypothetical protein